MNNDRSMGRWIFFTLCFCPVSAMAVITIQPNESNGILTNDSFRSESIFSFQDAMSVGDFNGDGLDDVAIKMFTFPYPPPAQVSIEIFFAPFGNGEKFSTKAHCTFIGAGISVDIPSQRMADLNGDGRDDLAVYRHDATSGLDQIQIVFGEENPPATIDLDQGDPALRILGAPGVVFGYKITAGDFNGDTVDDYAILASSISETSSLVYFLLGGASLPSGVVDLSIQNPFVRLMVNGEGGSLVTGNFDGDQCDDLAIGAYRAPGINDVFVFRGRDPFPSSGEILTTDVQIISHYIELGVYQSYISPVSAGDITGDHRDEIVLFGSVNQPNLWMLSGSNISSGRPILRQETGLPESVIFYTIPKSKDVFGDSLSKFADFDGDGAKDLFSLNINGIEGLFTTDVHPGGIPLDNLDVTSLVWVGGGNPTGGYDDSVNLGDFNGDGFQDLVAYENFNLVAPPFFFPYGALRFLYGFRPLKNPTISAPVETSESLRVTVSLSVDGNPTDMFFTGDVTAEFKDKWIPFRSSQELVLTPGGGPKTVRVRFRNAVGRESETVETAVTVRVEETRVLTETNRLRPGGRVSFDCHLQSAGVLRVRVYGPQGDEVIELENRQAESGIYPVQWDGRNVHGNRVARGVYFLVIEADGERTKKEILVE